MYGHVGAKFELATNHARHKTTSCRDPFVVVLPKQEAPREFVRVVSWTNCTHTMEAGWPDKHAASTSIVKSGNVRGGMVRTKAVMFAALRWPSWYEFIDADTSDWNWDKVVRQNDGVATHLLGEAVMPAMARAIMMSASQAALAPIRHLIDCFCCGGGFSLGAAEALPDLERADGIDIDKIVLRNYEHNLPKALTPSATVRVHETRAPSTYAGLADLLGHEPAAGTHLHLSPPCQAFVNGPKGSKPDLSPVFMLMLHASGAGCTCSFEEHRDAHRQALDWLDSKHTDPRARAKLHVYVVTARSYGSPTGRERCVVTTYALHGELDLNPHTPSNDRPMTKYVR